MDNPVPKPGQDTRVDPAALTTQVDAALSALDHLGDAASQLQALEDVHQRLAAALATIDRA